MIVGIVAYPLQSPRSSPVHGGFETKDDQYSSSVAFEQEGDGVVCRIGEIPDEKVV